MSSKHALKFEVLHIITVFFEDYYIYNKQIFWEQYLNYTIHNKNMYILSKTFKIEIFLIIYFVYFKNYYIFLYIIVLKVYIR